MELHFSEPEGFANWYSELSSSRSTNPERKNPCVAGKIRVSCKDRPLPLDRDGAQKDVDNRYGNSLCPAPIARLRRLFVIRYVDDFIRKRPEVNPQSFIWFRCLRSSCRISPIIRARRSRM